jgi:hypothetical protein
MSLLTHFVVGETQIEQVANFFNAFSLYARLHGSRLIKIVDGAALLF